MLLSESRLSDVVDASSLWFPVSINHRYILGEKSNEENFILRQILY